jgi:hypothetical protein
MIYFHYKSLSLSPLYKPEGCLYERITLHVLIVVRIDCCMHEHKKGVISALKIALVL